MAEPVKAVAVTSEVLEAKVKPVAALRTAWKTTLLNVISFVASLILLILGYLQTINVAAVLTPTQALLWTAAVNILTLMLRAYGVRPIVLDPPKEMTVKDPPKE
jgi:hypothetical protein